MYVRGQTENPRLGCMPRGLLVKHRESGHPLSLSLLASSHPLITEHDNFSSECKPGRRHGRCTCAARWRGWIGGSDFAHFARLPQGGSQLSRLASAFSRLSTVANCWRTPGAWGTREDSGRVVLLARIGPLFALRFACAGHINQTPHSSGGCYFSDACVHVRTRLVQVPRHAQCPPQTTSSPPPGATTAATTVP